MSVQIIGLYYPDACRTKPAVPARKKETSSSCFLLLEVLVPAKVVLQPQHNNYLTIIRSPNNSSLNEYWNS